MIKKELILVVLISLLLIPSVSAILDITFSPDPPVTKKNLKITITPSTSFYGNIRFYDSNNRYLGYAKAPCLRCNKKTTIIKFIPSTWKGTIHMKVYDYNTHRWVTKLFNIEAPKTCSDSDKGLDYYKKGTVTYFRWGRTRKYSDYCRGNRLVERYCYRGKVRSKYYTCKNGCKEGACLNILKKGTVSQQGVECKPGQKIGDVNGDGKITTTDAELAMKISLGIIPKPADLCCVDINKDSKVDISDVVKIKKIVAGLEESPGVCPVECKPGQKIGDVNGDGEINIFDVMLVLRISIELTKKPSDLCCVDINQDGEVNIFDVIKTLRIAIGLEESPGVCIPIPIEKNQKDISRYSNREVFLISDKNWQDVLQLVPLTTWTASTKEELQNCVKGYGTPEDVCVYPTLIYHDETTAEKEKFDADSIIYFMQQYQDGKEKVTIIGETPKELDNLLIAKPEFGAGISQDNIKRISVNDYFSYWKSFDTVVYVENDYEKALMASTYASLINAPLIIEGTSLDKDGIFKGRKVICVGSVKRNCDEQYSLEQLQKKYVDMTKTDKIILVNPNDLNIKVEEEFQPEKSSNKIYELYSKTSLGAPVLASAKHEVIISTTNKDHIEVRKVIKSKVSSIGSNIKYLTILASPGAIENSFKASEIGGIFSRALLSMVVPWVIHSEADHYFYARLDDDFFLDLNVGRIYSLTDSDVSSYIARDLFYNKIGKANKFGSLYAHSQFVDFKSNSFAVEKLLKEKGLVSESVYTDNSSTPTLEAEDLKNKIYISHFGHGNWMGVEGIDTSDLTGIYLDPAVIVSTGCLTCADATLPINYTNSHNKTFHINKKDLFCTNLIRRGALAYIGETEIGIGDVDLSDPLFLENLFDSSIGEAFTKFKEKNYQFKGLLFTCGNPSTLLGDPTFKLGWTYPPVNKTNSKFEIVSDDTAILTLEIPAYYGTVNYAGYGEDISPGILYERLFGNEVLHLREYKKKPTYKSSFAMVVEERGYYTVPFKLKDYQITNISKIEVYFPPEILRGITPISKHQKRWPERSLWIGLFGSSADDNPYFNYDTLVTYEPYTYIKSITLFGNKGNYNLVLNIPSKNQKRMYKIYFGITKSNDLIHCSDLTPLRECSLPDWYCNENGELKKNEELCG